MPPIQYKCYIEKCLLYYLENNDLRGKIYTSSVGFFFFWVCLIHSWLNLQNGWPTRFMVFINVKYVFRHDYVLCFIELFKQKSNRYGKCQCRCCCATVAAQGFACAPSWRSLVQTAEAERETWPGVVLRGSEGAWSHATPWAPHSALSRDLRFNGRCVFWTRMWDPSQ